MGEHRLLRSLCALSWPRVDEIRAPRLESSSWRDGAVWNWGVLPVVSPHMLGLRASASSQRPQGGTTNWGVMLTCGYAWEDSAQWNLCRGNFFFSSYCEEVSPVKPSVFPHKILICNITGSNITLFKKKLSNLLCRRCWHEHLYVRIQGR